MPQSASIPSTSQRQELIYSAIFARLERVEREKLALKQGQTDILKGQTEIMGCLKTLLVLMGDPRRPNAEVDPHPVPVSSGDEFILPNDYRHYDVEDVLHTPQNMSITSIGDTQDSECGVCDNHNMVMVHQMTASERQFRTFEWDLMDNKVVPQTKSSGDYGTYVIEHIEHKLLDRPFVGVDDDHMSLFR
uniref:Uncharacterized protein n=1 Tax=Cannabis sativa TaxID=3483 RepID=A0A803P9E2_CANSA